MFKEKNMLYSVVCINSEKLKKDRLFLLESIIYIMLPVHKYALKYNEQMEPMRVLKISVLKLMGVIYVTGNLYPFKKYTNNIIRNICIIL